MRYKDVPYGVNLLSLLVPKGGGEAGIVRERYPLIPLCTTAAGLTAGTRLRQ